MRETTHLADETLVRFADSELDGRQTARVNSHLEACSSCRQRLAELNEASSAVAALHRDTDSRPLPSPAGPRALLRARLRQSAVPGLLRWPPVLVRGLGYAAAVVVVVALVWNQANVAESAAKPRPDLTPGAVRHVAALDVCSADLGDNSEVQPAVQRLVFAEYGMPDAEAAHYEVDYLITPAL